MKSEAETSRYKRWYINTPGTKTTICVVLLLVAAALVLIWVHASSDTNNDEVLGESFVVSFDSTGGTSMPSQSVAKGGYSMLPIVPQKTGYNFILR